MFYSLSVWHASPTLLTSQPQRTVSSLLTPSHGSRNDVDKTSIDSPLSSIRSSFSTTATSSCSTARLTPAILTSTRDPDTKDFPCHSCHAPYPSHHPSCPPVHFFCKECFAPEPIEERTRRHFSFCKLGEKRRYKRGNWPSQLEPLLPEWDDLLVSPGFLREENLGALGWDAEVYGDSTPVQRRLVREAEGKRAEDAVKSQSRETAVKSALSRSVSSS